MLVLSPCKKKKKIDKIQKELKAALALNWRGKKNASLELRSIFTLLLQISFLSLLLIADNSVLDTGWARF